MEAPTERWKWFGTWANEIRAFASFHAPENEVWQGRCCTAGVNPEPNLLGVMDADLQHPPELLPELLQAAEQADIAIASRYARNHGTKGWNPLRVAVSRLSTLAAAPLISRKHLRVTDPMSGFFLIHRRCIEGLTFQTTGFKVLLEILVRGRIQTAQEIPFHFGVRQAGRSKANATVAFHYLHLLGRLSRDLVLRSSEP